MKQAAAIAGIIILFWAFEWIDTTAAVFFVLIYLLFLLMKKIHGESEHLPPRR